MRWLVALNHFRGYRWLGSAGRALWLPMVVDPSTFAERAPERAAAIFDAVGGRRSEITNVNWSRGLIDAAEFTTTWPPAVFDRLAAARTKYDPSGVFAFGPAAE